jgi:succinoglycan biosynthesis transport protein ExoP
MENENLPAFPRSTSRLHDQDLADEAIPVSQPEYEPPASGMKLNDILFILFRHKWKILFCTALGLLGAAAVYFLLPPIYESKAKLIVRYVVDRSTVDNLESAVKTPGTENENLINSEVEILTSQDVAMQVAEAVGVSRLVKHPKSKDVTSEAAREVLRGLDVSALKGSNIISLSYKSPDPVLAREVLEQLVKFYFDKHLEVHRSVGGFDLVSRQTDQLRTELKQTEEELKQLKTKAAITSLPEDTAALATELTKTQHDAGVAEADLAAQQARVQELDKWASGGGTKPSENGAMQQPGSGVAEEYRSLVTRVAQLRQTQTELLSKYTPQNRIVKVKQAQIEELEKQRLDIEKKYPALVATMPAATSGEVQAPRPDLLTERAKLVAAQSQAQTLRARMDALEERSKTLTELGPRIGQLERTKAVQEANYKYLEASLEKAKIDETLDPSRMPNIGTVEKPTTAEKTIRDVKKFVLGLAAGGLGVGIAIALLIELVLDRTIKRSGELETKLQIPLLLSIPNLAEVAALRLHDTGQDSESLLQESGDLLRPFCEAIRDRLGLFFEVNRMSHKPKLVAVTGLSKKAGASTLAAGLAATLSENNDGKVLLVDKPYAPKKFYDMLTEFKGSNFDYVIFDMPSVGAANSTLPLAGFMDTVLMVVEAEKSNREAVKKAYAQLAAKTNVSVIFNKSRSYGPKWLEGEL